MAISIPGWGWTSSQQGGGMSTVETHGWRWSSQYFGCSIWNQYQVINLYLTIQPQTALDHWLHHQNAVVDGRTETHRYLYLCIPEFVVLVFFLLTPAIKIGSAGDSSKPPWWLYHFTFYILHPSCEINQKNLSFHSNVMIKHSNSWRVLKYRKLATRTTPRMSIQFFTPSIPEDFGRNLS